MARLLARHASGVSLKQISVEEYMSYRAVLTLAAETRERLEAVNMAQAAIKACKLGYIALPDDEGIVIALSPYSDQ